LKTRKFIISKYNFENPEKDLDHILSFYEKHKAKEIKERELVELIRSTEHGQVFRVQDENDNMIAISCIFTHFNGSYEAGGTLVPEEGLRLQAILHKIRLLHSFLWHKPNDVYFTAIADTNKKSISGTIKCGFVEWSPEPSFLLAVGKTEAGTYSLEEQSDQPEPLSQQEPKLLFFNFDRNKKGAVERLREFSKEIVGYHNGDLHTLGDGTSAQLIFNFPMLQQRRIRERLP